MRELQTMLDQRPDLQNYLFRRGFLITNREPDLTVYPFYNNWTKTDLTNGFAAYVHRDQKVTVHRDDSKCYVLIGHAYDPYTMEWDEAQMLHSLASRENRQAYIDEWTGVFFLCSVSEREVRFLTDASSMQYACYGEIAGSLYITSHMRLVGDLCNLSSTDYAERLIHYRWYPLMMGNYMPGDITCFQELTRLVPNTFVTYHGHEFSVTRFYPSHSIHMCQTEEEYSEVIREGARVLQNTMQLIPKKWEHPAISLTGGIDSNTTFAAANGVYDRYTTFSYVSMMRESVDAEKAKEISKRFDVPWKCYEVPDDNSAIKDFDLLQKVLEWNAGGIGKNHDSDTRKKITLMQQNVCDVEVKSWISETIRAYAYKYFGRTKFPKDLSARNYTSLYKIFAMNRKLVRETDDYFKTYWHNTQLKEHLFNYDESDFFVWEMMHGGKCGLDIGTMKTCFDITIPYNNRKFLDTMLRVPLERRLSDQLHLDMKKVLNQELYDMNIRVVNLNETTARKRMANVYFTVNSHLPF